MASKAEVDAFFEANKGARARGVNIAKADAGTLVYGKVYGRLELHDGKGSWSIILHVSKPFDFLLLPVMFSSIQLLGDDGLKICKILPVKIKQPFPAQAVNNEEMKKAYERSLCHSECTDGYCHRRYTGY